MKTLHIVEWLSNKDFDTMYTFDYAKSQEDIRKGMQGLLHGTYGYVKVWTYEVREDLGLNDFDIEALVGQLEENEFKGAEQMYHIEIDDE